MQSESKTLSQEIRNHMAVQVVKSVMMQILTLASYCLQKMVIY